MKTTTQIITLIILIIVLVILVPLRKRLPSVLPTPTPTVEAPAGVSSTYSCNDGKRIDVLNGKDGVQLTLSDGRSLALPRSRSADGTRYANADESFVFWSKGNGALVLENNQEKSYIGCIIVAKDPGGLPQVYSNGSEGFSIRLPEGFTVDPNFKNDLAPGKSISGVKFAIPAALAAGTNLSVDSYISFESIPNSATCSANMFDTIARPPVSVTEGDITYSVSSSNDAAAGNRYDQKVFALPWTNPCIGIHYFIHYGAIGNYPEGKVKEFDETALLATFDSIRKTLVINPSPAAPVADTHEPYSATLTGTRACLPHKDTSGPQTLECALGMKADTGEYYSLDLNQASPATKAVLDKPRFTATGTVTPVERLNSNQYQKYNMVGIFTVTSATVAN